MEGGVRGSLGRSIAGNRCGTILRRVATFALENGLAEDELDLAVDATELVARPDLQVGPEVRGNAKQESFASAGAVAHV